jgi:hypothetical protein
MRGNARDAAVQDACRGGRRVALARRCSQRGSIFGGEPEHTRDAVSVLVYARDALASKRITASNHPSRCQTACHRGHGAFSSRAAQGRRVLRRIA